MKTQTISVIFKSILLVLCLSIAVVYGSKAQSSDKSKKATVNFDALYKDIKADSPLDLTKKKIEALDKAIETGSAIAQDEKQWEEIKAFQKEKDNLLMTQNTLEEEHAKQQMQKIISEPAPQE